MAIPIAVIPVAPLCNPAEVVAIVNGELACVLEVADTSVISPTELLLARKALLTIPDFMALAAATPAFLDASKIAIAARLLLYALLPLPLVTVGLEVGETALAATAPVHALRLTLLPATLDALRLTFTATATLHALSLAAAAAFHALRLLAATAAAALGLLAATTAPATLGLGMAASTLSSALIGLR